MNRIPVINPIPELIAEMIEAGGHTKAEVAAALGVPATRVSELVAGKLRINAELAIRLSRVWPDSDPSYWLGIQNEIDLREVSERKAADLSAVKRLRPAKKAG
jgi:addiction module HigA family antidote